MATKSGTLVVNAAFLEEIKNDNVHLNRLLTSVGEYLSNLQRVQPGVLVRMLESLRDQLSTHFSLEEYFGYFDDAIEVAPRLSTMADILRSQHKTLLGDVCELVSQATKLVDSSVHPRMLTEIVVQFRTFQRRLDEHEAGERDLIMQALYDDIGVGD